MSLYLVVPALVGIGFLLGFFSFKIRTRWCRHCGVTLRCPDCAGTRSVASPFRVRGAAR